MKSKPLYLILLTLILAGCSQQSETEKYISEMRQYSDSPLFKEIQSQMDIPKNWIEATQVDNKWTYFIPADKNLQKIILTDIHDTIIWNNGIEEHLYLIESLTLRGDSLTFKTVSARDSTSALISFKYLDEEKSISRWSLNGKYNSTFIPTSDTIKFAKRSPI